MRLVDLLIKDEKKVIRVEDLSMKLELAFKSANEDALKFVSIHGLAQFLNSKFGHISSVY